LRERFGVMRVVGRIAGTRTPLMFEWGLSDGETRHGAGGV
jgi:hypothetical protein